MSATAAAKATQAAEEKDRLAEAKNVLRDSIISAPSKLTRKEGCALTSSIAPIGRSTNARKGNQPSQMGSLSLMAGFFHNHLFDFRFKLFRGVLFDGA